MVAPPAPVGRLLVRDGVSPEILRSPGIAVFLHSGANGWSERGPEGDSARAPGAHPGLTGSREPERLGSSPNTATAGEAP